MRIKTLRYYAATLTGILTFFAAAAAQWIWTQRPVQDVIFIALMAAFIVVAVFVVATESMHKQQRRKHRARPVKRYELERPVTITLNRREWNQ